MAKEKSAMHLLKWGAKVLIVRPDAIGDVMLLLPAIKALKEARPDLHITLMLQAYTAELMTYFPEVDEVFIDWKKKGLLGFFSYARHLRSLKFDAVIYAFFQPYHTWLGVFSGIPIRIGDSQKFPLTLLLTHPVKQHFRNIGLHEVEHNFTLLKPLLSSFNQPKESPILRGVQTGAAKDLLKANGWDGVSELICIHPSTGGGNRAWLPEKYADLISLISQNTGYQIVLTGFGQKEKQIIDTILSHTQASPIVLFEKTSLKELVCVLACCQAVIGTDTGPTHVSAGINVPVLCISPTKFVKSLRWGPWQTKNRVINASEACDKVCNPYSCRETLCLDAITPERVFQELQLLLKENRSFDKEAWLKASISVGIYIHSFQKDEEWVSLAFLLQEQGYRLVLIFEGNQVKRDSHTVQARVVEQVSAYAFSKWHQLITQYDIEVLYLPFQNSFLKKAFWFLMRQCVAPLITAPPLIQPYPSSDSSTIAPSLLQAFEKN